MRRLLAWSIALLAGSITSLIAPSFGGVVITVYFTAGGLLTAAWVNVVQLAVKIAGFGVAFVIAVNVLDAVPDNPPGITADYFQFLRSGSPGLALLATIVPPFIVSPGLLQKIFGARDDRAVRIGVGLNALGLALFAIVPATLGIAARTQFPSLVPADAALPMLLVHTLPPLAGRAVLIVARGREDPLPSPFPGR